VDVARLNGKVAIITGGARGQGAAEARLFAAEAATVVVTDVRAELGRAVAAEAGGLFLEHDVTSETAWQAVVRRVLDAYGRVDVLVNNAGIFRRGGLATTTLAEYRQVVDVNQIGVFLGMQAVAPTMIAQRSGSIVNISSIAGFTGSAGAIAYGASKWAVRGMTKAAALEMGRYGIRVNSVHPGGIYTAMHGSEFMSLEQADKYYHRHALPRVGRPHEVAYVTLFLATDEASYSTGAEFAADGGWHAGLVDEMMPRL
jgi:3alpha(or 20beta)-hydroxysteroid dehydrogenase